jgi:diguanylate cyclase (GGDEF)-like protein
MSELTARDLMNPVVVTTTPDALLAEVIETMLSERHSCVLVCEEQRAIGIITERDIVRLMSRFMTNRQTADVVVAEVMSQPITTLSEETPLFEALVISSSQQIRHLPVVDSSGQIKGLVTQASLAQAHLKVYEQQREIIEQSVTKRTRELSAANEQLQSLCMLDALTGLGNRRAMEIDLEHSHSQALRYERSYSMAIFDVDYFKRYNDHYGHAAGDDALRSVANHLQTCIRKSDRLYRYGGEEILLILPETALHGALILAERILESFADLKILHEKSTLGFVTMSCGLACQTELSGFATWQKMFDHADRSLYVAKHRGRNQLAFLPPEDATDELAPRLHGDENGHTS